ncbi:Zinc finger BED domain-containing protein RICESLEEPER 2 [Linum perenne]
MLTLKITLTFVNKLPLSGEIFHVLCCAHILNILVQFLELFIDVMNIISGSSYATANVFLPKLWRIKVLLKNTIQSSDESMKAMTIKMQQKFDKYWGDSNLVMAFAVVLDLRTKMRVIEVSFSDL